MPTPLRPGLSRPLIVAHSNRIGVHPSQNLAGRPMKLKGWGPASVGLREDARSGTRWRCSRREGRRGPPAVAFVVGVPVSRGEPDGFRDRRGPRAASDRLSCRGPPRGRHWGLSGGREFEEASRSRRLARGAPVAQPRRRLGPSSGRRDARRGVRLAPAGLSRCGGLPVADAAALWGCVGCGRRGRALACADARAWLGHAPVGGAGDCWGAGIGRSPAAVERLGGQGGLLVGAVLVRRVGRHQICAAELVVQLATMAIP